MAEATEVLLDHQLLVRAQAVEVVREDILEMAVTAVLQTQQVQQAQDPELVAVVVELEVTWGVAAVA